MKFNFNKTLDHRYDGSYRWAQPEGRSDVLGMGTADMDYFCAPSILEATRRIAEENTFNYRGKSEEYYNALTNFFKRRYDLDIRREWLNNIPCTLAIVRMLMELFAGKDHWVIMQTPYFAPLRSCIEGAGCRFLENPMVLKDGRYELDLEDFEKKIVAYHPAIYMMVNPQNPTGRVFTQEELEKIVDICARNHVLIVSDEVHFLITYDGHRHIPILAVNEKAREISVQLFSMSKGFNMMSLPHAMTLIANPELQKKWLDFLFSYDFHYAVNTFAMAAVTAAAGEEAEHWLDACTDYLKENMELFFQFVEEKKLPIKPLRPEAGYLLWIDCRESGLDAERLGEEFLEKAGISLNNGLEHGEAGRGFVRLNFAVTRSVMKAALERIERMFWQGLGRSHE